MFIDLLRSRRSIRRFTDQPVAPEQLDLLVEAAVRSFSSKGINPWEFVVVQDRTTIEALAAAKTHGSAFLRHAPLAIAVCADPAKSDVWLGSCWVQIRRREHDATTSAQDYVAGLLGLPPGMMVLAIIGIGHPVETKAGHPRGALPFAQVSRERFGRRD